MLVNKILQVSGGQFWNTLSVHGIPKSPSIAIYHHAPPPGFVLIIHEYIYIAYLVWGCPWAWDLSLHFTLSPRKGLPPLQMYRWQETFTFFFFFHIAYSSLSFSCHFENYLWKVLGLCKLVPYNLTGYGSRIKSYHKSHRIFCFLFYHHSSKLMAGGCVFGCCCQNLALKFLSYFSLY